jgi:hypothetical protein
MVRLYCVLAPCALLIGCTSIAPTALSVQDHAEAVSNFPGFRVSDGSAARITMEWPSKHTRLLSWPACASGARQSIVVNLPEAWHEEGWLLSSSTHLAAQYHWAITQWRRPDGKRSVVALRAFGPEDIYLDVDERRTAISPGTVVEIASGR